MGNADDIMAEQDSKRHAAYKIALKARVLKPCKYHEDEVIVSEDKEIVEAYKLGNARFEKDSLGEVFDSRTDMTDYIKEVVEDANTDCWICDKMRSDE
jgi:hypothetical protein